MTGSASDKALLQPHVYNKLQKKRLEKRFKNPKDPLKLVIVRDMWLTGFDAPCVHTMYVDKPMKGHNLMQAIARANRKAPGKNNGLVVDYNGMLKSLRAALAKYGEGSTSGGGGGTGGELPPTADLDELEQELVVAIEACEAARQWILENPK